MKKTSNAKADADSPSELIDARIKELGDWRGETLAKVRNLIRQADPDIVEEWKWRGVPVWEHDGIICTGETYKEVVKLTFAKGAARTSAFNASSSISSPSRMSMARLTLPSRLELKSFDGSSSAAPLAKVSLTTSL